MIQEIREAGIISYRGIAKALTARGVKTYQQELIGEQTSRRDESKAHPMWRAQTVKDLILKNGENEMNEIDKSKLYKKLETAPFEDKPAVAGKHKRESQFYDIYPELCDFFMEKSWQPVVAIFYDKSTVPSKDVKGSNIA